jgi:uncharacterized membrane protein YcjF (UPF0283 family)
MSHGPEHHIEHAEHAAHARHDNFDKQVTISIAMVAAVLAAITMLGHRAHNETLQLQGEALVAQSEAGIQHNQATNKWGQYQANNIRDHMYQSMLELTEGLDVKPERKAAIQSARTRWESQRKKYDKNMPEIMGDAKALMQKGSDFERESKAKLAESHDTHARSTRFDLGELGLQLGVVLCSLAILTKRRAFWLIGLLCSLVGLVTALTGLFGVLLGGGHH